MINYQVQLITEMYSSTFIHLLVYKVGLIPAFVLLDYYQRLYSYLLSGLPNFYPIKQI